MKNWRLVWVVILLVSCHSKKPPKEKEIPKVKTTQVLTKKIPLYLEGMGHLTAYNSAEIKAQVEGELMQIHFEQGQIVFEGDLLFTIDPRPYRAKLAAAKAQLKENESGYQFAVDRLTRYEPLVEENYVSQLNFDKYTSDVEFYKAAIEKNKAQILEAEINLSYCYIRAPFSGKVGKRLIDIGNLIVNDGKSLLTINQLDPLFVDFSLPEKYLFQIEQAQKMCPLSIEVQTLDHANKLYRAKLIMVDNFVNKKTGMIFLRGEMQNQDMKLLTGQFIRTKLILGEKKDALLIPVQALTNGQKGQFVFVVQKNYTAIAQLVQTGERLGNWIEITKGLKANEMIILDGQINVKNKKPVQIIEHVEPKLPKKILEETS